MATADEKLDRLGETVTEVRVLLAGLASDLRAALGRAEEQDKARARLEGRVDGVERDLDARLSAVERRVWAVPSVATLISVVGLVVAVYERAS